MTDIAGIILCGGESRRMGQPKAWLPFGPETLLQRVVRLLGGVASPVIVVAAPGQELPALPSSIAVVRDAVEGRGPLQGLLAGLSALPADVELAYLTATDVPFLMPQFIQRLVQLIDRADLAIPYAGGYYHPLAALYRPSAVRPVVESLLARQRLVTMSLVDQIRSRIVTAEELRTADPLLDTLRNLNTRADYEQALKEVRLAE